ncbi:MAG: hypothetical protein ABGW81_04520, partial [Paracoccaceae bacterium]
MIRIVIILLLLPVLASAQSLTPAGRVVIRTDIQGVGGLSGIEVRPVLISVFSEGRVFFVFTCDLSFRRKGSSAS